MNQWLFVVLSCLIYVVCSGNAAQKKLCATDSEEQCSAVGEINSGWRHNASQDAIAALSCSMPIVNAQSMSLVDLAKRCAAADTPLLIRGLYAKPPWKRSISELSNWSATLDSFGDEQVMLSIGAYLAQGPEMENPRLNKEKLVFMRETWANDGSSFRWVAKNRQRSCY
jgi:hypothetical protein